MPKRALRDALDAVRRTLRDADALDPGDRAVLADLHADIERALESTEEMRAAGPRIEHGVMGAVHRFEVEHPQLTAMLNRLAEVLAGTGV